MSRVESGHAWPLFDLQESNHWPAGQEVSVNSAGTSWSSPSPTSTAAMA